MSLRLILPDARPETSFVSFLAQSVDQGSQSKPRSTAWVDIWNRPLGPPNASGASTRNSWSVCVRPYLDGSGSCAPSWFPAQASCRKSCTQQYGLPGGNGPSGFGRLHRVAASRAPSQLAQPYQSFLGHQEGSAGLARSPIGLRSPDRLQATGWQAPVHLR